MRHGLGWGLSWALLGLLGCPGDDGNAEGGPSSTGATTSTSGPSATSTGPDASSSGGGGSSSGGMASSSSSGSVADSSSSGGPVCDPLVVGEWNACMDDMGNIDNTLCNWVGDPDSNGYLTCLSSGELRGANVCIIRDCVDTCDCFEPPATGTAEVVCAPILEGGDMGCGLDCSEGQTCPDGMECSSGLCFWPPA